MDLCVHTYSVDAAAAEGGGDVDVRGVLFKYLKNSIHRWLWDWSTKWRDKEICVEFKHKCIIANIYFHVVIVY